MNSLLAIEGAQNIREYEPEPAFDDCAGAGPVGLGVGFEPGLLGSSSAKIVSSRASTPATACDRKLPHLDLFPCAAMALRLAGYQMAWPSSCGRGCNERRQPCVAGMAYKVCIWPRCGGSVVASSREAGVSNYKSQEQ